MVCLVESVAAKPNMNSRAKMSAMNPGEPVASNEHEQDRFLLRVSFVLRIRIDHSQIHAAGFLRPVAVLAVALEGTRLLLSSAGGIGRG